MSIAFDQDRWQHVKDTYRQWWAGTLKRPLISITMSGRDPGRPAPALAGIDFTTGYDISISPDAVVDRWDYDLSCQTFMGDAFPCVWPNLGPGAIAAFMPGGMAEPKPDTVWFHPKQAQDITTLRFDFDPTNACFLRLLAICRAAMSRWKGAVQVGMTDLGGNLDIVSTFRPSEQLLLDLYDHPREVQRLAWEAHAAWWKYFAAINAVLQPLNPGYTTWTPIYSETPYYMLQCDFCYMIGPEMFDTFVKPELAEMCRKLDHAFYHLDGPGELPHLDSLLTIPDLKGVQWVPGAGQPDQTHWPEVLRKIRKAGKLLQIWGDIATLETISAQLGSAEGIILIGGAAPQDRPAIESFIRDWGA